MEIIEKDTLERKKFLVTAFFATLGLASLAQPPSKKPHKHPDGKSSAINNREGKVMSAANRPSKSGIPNATLDRSRIRPFDRDHDWQEARDRIITNCQENFSVTTDNKLINDFHDNFKKIEGPFVLDTHEEDFLYFQVEDLLDQSASLLERGLKDRAEYDDKCIKLFNQTLEINQYWELEKIHNLEQQAGIYELDALLALADLNAANRNLDALSFYKDILQGINDNYFNTTQLNKVLGAFQQSAWAGGLIPGDYDNQEFLGFNSYTFDGQTNTIAELEKQAAFIIKAHDLWAAADQAFSQIYSVEPNLVYLAEKLRGLNSKQNWEQANINFKIERLLVARKYMDLKTKSACDEDGILNYTKRITPIRTRFANDFNEALSRLNVAIKGLKSVFNYQEADLPIWADDKIGHYDNCLVWTRNAINWLIRFKKKDQLFILPISIRSLMTGSEWSNGVRNRKFVFKIDEDIFLNKLYHVRLKSLSGFVMGLKEHELNGMIQADVQLPIKSFSRRFDDSKTPLDQSMLPVCRLSRIATRDYIRAPEVAGSYWLNNISPFGTWTIELSTPYDRIAPKEMNDNTNELVSSYKTKMCDLILDLHLIVKAK